jgi:hypothetical protein
MNAQNYIRRIRNPAKKDYAWDYFYHLKREWPEPVKPAGLSYMAAQAVEMRLMELEANRLNPTRRQ